MSLRAAAQITVLLLTLASGGCVRLVTGLAGDTDASVVPPTDGPRPERPAAGDGSSDLAAPGDGSGGEGAPLADGGCPASYTRCGAVCVRLSSDPEHCGTCDRVCGAESDRCSGGRCVCGEAERGCGAGLTCSAGACNCAPGQPACRGCCAGSTCIGRADQTAAACGHEGARCDPCEGQRSCGVSACTDGECHWQNEPDGTPCDDGLACTGPDACTAGSCRGTAEPGACVIDDVCFSSAAASPTDPCLTCDPTVSQTSFTPQADPGCVVTLAGVRVSGYLDGSGAAAKLSSPTGVTLVGGALYVADTGNHRLRALDLAQRAVSTLAGDGTVGGRDGPALTAQLNGVTGLVLGATTAYLADRDNHRIRSLAGDVVGTITGASAGYVDGETAVARFNHPTAVALDAAGDVLVADTDNHRIRAIRAGVVSTVAGSGGTGGSSGGFVDGAAANARFDRPTDLVLDGDTIYVADMGNNRIRKIVNGTVSTVAGSGSAGWVDGAGTAARFDAPFGIALTPSKNLVVTDQGNRRVRIVDLSGATPQVQTLAGGGSWTGLPDGALLNARFSSPAGVAVDAAGLVYVGDRGEHTLRLIVPSAIP